jgi:hypothetical protein
MRCNGWYVDREREREIESVCDEEEIDNIRVGLNYF